MGKLYQNASRSKILLWPKMSKLFHLTRRYLSSRITDRAELMTYIHENTIVDNNSLTPEIQLHLITPECPLWHAGEEDCRIPDPFWAFYWPGGQAITRYILDNQPLFKDSRLVDIGSGCGASAIAAKKVHAKCVIANDICNVAAMAMEMNSRGNDVDLEISTDNFITDKQIDDCDVVILGDMFYDSEFTNIVYTWILELHKRGIDVLIGDPGRVYLLNHPISSRLKLLQKYDLPCHTCLENNGFSQGFVWKFD